VLDEWVVLCFIEYAVANESEGYVTTDKVFSPLTTFQVSAVYPSCLHPFSIQLCLIGEEGMEDWEEMGEEMEEEMEED
jgi:hypothetical protein